MKQIHLEEIATKIVKNKLYKKLLINQSKLETQKPEIENIEILYRTLQKGRQIGIVRRVIVMPVYYCLVKKKT